MLLWHQSTDNGSSTTNALICWCLRIVLSLGAYGVRLGIYRKSAPGPVCGPIESHTCTTLTSAFATERVHMVVMAMVEKIYSQPTLAPVFLFRPDNPWIISRHYSGRVLKHFHFTFCEAQRTQRKLWEGLCYDGATKLIFVSDSAAWLLGIWTTCGVSAQ